MPRLFAVCAPGLEPFTAREMKDLGFRVSAPAPSPPEPPPAEEGEGEVGGVEFQGTLSDLYSANLHLRTASRVLCQLGSFYADQFSDLGRRAGRLPWESYLSPGKPVALRVTCRKSRLFHSGAVEERVREAMGGRLGQAPPSAPGEAGGDAPQLILIRLVENRCTISLDSSGALLHRRGYRLATAKAPLRETLAAGILLASGWDRGSALIDPFCGSGAIPIEAALMAGNIPPGLRRGFAFMDWPNFDRGLWEKLRAHAQEGRTRSSPPILGSDRDAGAVRAALANAERAGVAGGIEFTCRPISALRPPGGPGWLVTNPPYGVRLKSGSALHLLYNRLGRVVRERLAGWHWAILSNSQELMSATGLRGDRRVALRNGGLKVFLSLGRAARGREKAV